MKKTFALIIGIVMAVSTAFATNGEGTTSYEINTKESKVFWTATKITGAAHSGYISIASGTVLVKENLVSGASLKIDLNSIVNTDIEDKEYSDKLVGHLKSDDFFSVEKHPLANFEITSVEKANGSEYTVAGKLTIKGITNDILFPAKINVSGGKVTAYGTAKLDRTKWDIKYGSGSFFSDLGDKAINDEFEIKFELSANESSSTPKL